MEFDYSRPFIEQLPSSVISGEIPLEEFSVELFPNRNNKYLYSLLSYHYPEFKEWYSSTKNSRHEFRSAVKYFQRHNLDYRSLDLNSVFQFEISLKQLVEQLGISDCWTNFSYYLKRVRPDYNSWYDSSKDNRKQLMINNRKKFYQDRLVSKFGLSLEQIQDWKNLLGDQVLQGKQSIASRSLELLPKHQDCTLFKLLDVYSPDSFKEWYQSYSSPIHSWQSSFERRLFDYLSDFHPVQYNKLPRKGQIDIYLPDQKIGFELNGYFYHCYGNPSSDRGASINRYYHRDKTTAALQQGIKLYHLWHDREGISNYDKLLSIINSKLGINLTEYSAGSFSVVKISTKEACKFYQEHHLQGSPSHNLNYSYALYNQQHGIVAAISFRKVGEQWDLCRYAVKSGLRIKFGFTKLFKHALNNLPDGDIISFGERDLVPDPYDSVYSRNGFKLVNSEPFLQMEFYVPNKIVLDGVVYQGVYSRQTFQKKKLLQFFPDEDSSLREIDIAIKHGIFPCYNSGCWKFIYNR